MTVIDRVTVAISGKDAGPVVENKSPLIGLPRFWPFRPQPLATLSRLGISYQAAVPVITILPLFRPVLKKRPLGSHHESVNPSPLTQVSQKLNLG